jgi:hypothetical protein
MLVAVSASRLWGGKTRTLMPVWGFIWRISAKTRELGFATMVFRFCDNGIGTFEPIQQRYWHFWSVRNNGCKAKAID